MARPELARLVDRDRHCWRIARRAPASPIFYLRGGSCFLDATILDRYALPVRLRRPRTQALIEEYGSRAR